MSVDDYIEDLTTTIAYGSNNGTDAYYEDGETEAPLIISNVTTTISFLPLGLGIIIVTVFGILGNFVSSLVLSRKRFQSSYTVLTLGLTFVDTVYLITKLLRYGLASAFAHYETAAIYLNVWLPVAGPYLRAITFTAHTASTYFTIAISIDRFIAICRPAKAKKFCTIKFARFTFLLVLVWSFAFNATRWLEFRSVEVNNEKVSTDTISSTNDSESIFKMEITELRHDPLYKEVYIFWTYLVVMFIVPFVSLSILNLCIFIGIRRMVRNSTPLTSTQRRDTSFSIMLIGVVLVFLFCNVDYLVLDILEYTGVEFSEFWNHLGNLLLTINSAVNFIIYCLCGWKFRQELWRLIRDFCPCLKHHGSHDIAVTDECQWVKDTMNHIDLQSIPRVSLSTISNSKSNM